MATGSPCEMRPQDPGARRGPAPPLVSRPLATLPPAVASLAERDRELLAPLVRRRSTGQIAAAMAVTPNPCTRIRWAQRKPAVGGRDEAARWARVLGLG